MKLCLSSSVTGYGSLHYMNILRSTLLNVLNIICYHFVLFWHCDIVKLIVICSQRSWHVHIYCDMFTDLVNSSHRSWHVHKSVSSSCVIYFKPCTFQKIHMVLHPKQGNYLLVNCLHWWMKYLYFIYLGWFIYRVIWFCHNSGMNIICFLFHIYFWYPGSCVQC